MHTTRKLVLVLALVCAGFHVPTAHAAATGVVFSTVSRARRLRGDHPTQKDGSQLEDQFQSPSSAGSRGRPYGDIEDSDDQTPGSYNDGSMHPWHSADGSQQGPWAPCGSQDWRPRPGSQSGSNEGSGSTWGGAIIVPGPCGYRFRHHAHHGSQSEVNADVSRGDSSDDDVEIWKYIQGGSRRGAGPCVWMGKRGTRGSSSSEPSFSRSRSGSGSTDDESVVVGSWLCGCEWPSSSGSASSIGQSLEGSRSGHGSNDKNPCEWYRQHGSFHDDSSDEHVEQTSTEGSHGDMSHDAADSQKS